MGAEVTRLAPFDMQVCVPADWTDQQVTAFANEAILCGTANGWVIRPQGDRALAGCEERVKCRERSDHVHIMLHA